MKLIKALLLFLVFCVNSFKAQVSVLAKVDHLVPDGIDTIGNINLTVSGSTAPYTYLWMPSLSVNKDLTNVGLGQHSVTVTSASAQTYTNVYSLGYKVLWTNLFNTFFRNDSLVSIQSSATWATACSKNTLLSNTDGWFEYVIDDLGANAYYIGFTDSLSPYSHGVIDIDYGIYYYLSGSTKTLYARENGSNPAILSSNPKIGDVVKVERTGNNIVYKINNVVIRTVSAASISQKNLKLKTNFYYKPNWILNVGCSFNNLSNVYFANYVQVTPHIQQNTDNGTSNGSITLIPQISGSYSYTWQPGGANTNSITGLSNGVYTVTVKDDLNNTSIYKYNVMNKAQWANLDKSKVQNDTVWSITGTSNINSAAITYNTLKPNVDGWFEVVNTHTATANAIHIGFTDSISPNPTTTTDIDFGIQHNIAHNAYTWRNGSLALMGPLKYGDILRVERIGNVINYKINGVIITYTNVPGISQKTIKVKLNLQINSLANVGCSFRKEDSITFPNCVKVIPTIGHNTEIGVNDGNIKVKLKNGIAATYTWNPGGIISNSITALGNGTYSVTVADSVQNNSRYIYEIGNKVAWTNLARCTYNNDSLKALTIATGYATAVSKNTLLANTDGWFEYVLDQYGSLNHYIGFTDSISPKYDDLNDFDYGFLYNASIKALYAREGTNNYLLSFILNVGDRLRVERVGNNIIYKLNGAIIRTVSNPNYATKKLKLKANLQSNMMIINLGCSFVESNNTYFDNYVQNIPTIKHAGSVYGNNGAIQLLPLVAGSYTYTWQPGGLTFNPNSNLSFGSYTSTTADALFNKSSYTYNVAYKVLWSNLNNTIAKNDTLSVVTSTYNVNNAACSKNILTANVDGWTEFIVNVLDDNGFYFGFADSTALSPVTLTEILYGFRYEPVSKYYLVYEAGAQPSSISSVRIGDVLRVERIGNTINYKVNGVLLRAITNTNIGPKKLKLKASLYYGAKIINLGCSFTPCTYTVSAGSSQSITCTNPTLTLTANTDAPAGSTYSWSPGGSTPTSSATTVSAAGVYTLEVTNPANGCVVTSTVAVSTNTTAPNLTMGGSSIPTLGLTAYWPFSGNAQDQSGNNYNGTVTGASLTTDRFGSANSAYDFNGSSDFISTSYAGIMGAGARSISFWAKTTYSTSSSTAVSWGNNAEGQRFNCGFNYMTNGATIGAANAAMTYSTPAQVSDNQWHHYVFQFNATYLSEAQIYQDGVLLTQATHAYNENMAVNTQPGFNVHFGKIDYPASPDYFKGQLDDIRFYNRLLSQNEIDALYNEPNEIVLTCANPSAVLTGSSTTSGLTYSWTPGGSTPTNSTTMVSSAGTYTLKVTDPINGCYNTATVSVTAPFTSNAIVDDCENDTIGGQVNLCIIGGIAPYNIAWNGIKLPSSSLVYQELLNSGYPVGPDSIYIKNQIDSLKQNRNNRNLSAGFYPVTIYDAMNDSIKMVGVVGSKITWYNNSAEVLSEPTQPKTINGITYYYDYSKQIMQQGTFSFGSNFAVINEPIISEQNNLIEFTVPDERDILYTSLLERVQAIDNSVENLKRKTCFEFTGDGNFYIWFDGVSSYTGTVLSGDEFGLSNDTATGKISYFRNKELIFERDFQSIESSTGFMFDVLFGSSNARLTGLRRVTPVQLQDRITANITDVGCEYSCSGSIDAFGTTALISSPQKYELFSYNPVTSTFDILQNTISSFPGGNHALFTNLCPGKFMVKYTCNKLPHFPHGGGAPTPIPSVISQIFEVGYKAEWVNTVGTSVLSPDNTLKRTLSPSGDNAGASTTNILRQSTNTEWVEFKVPNTEATIGLSITDANQSYSSINYAVWVRPMWFGFKVYSFINNGALVHWSIIPSGTNTTPNDIFRFEKTGNNLVIKINNIPSNIPSPIAMLPGNYIVDATIKTLNSKIVKPRMSFGCSSPDYFAELKKQYDAGYHQTKYGTLKFKFTEEYNADNLNFKVYNFKRQLVVTSPSLVTKKEGDNRYSINFTGMVPSGIYYLEVRNGKGEPMYLKFKL